MSYRAFNGERFLTAEGCKLYEESRFRVLQEIMRNWFLARKDTFVVNFPKEYDYEKMKEWFDRDTFSTVGIICVYESITKETLTILNEICNTNLNLPLEKGVYKYDSKKNLYVKKTDFN